MLKAQISGKVPSLENWEDILTSDVFGLLDYLDRKTIWKDFAAEFLDVVIDDPESLDAGFEFWPFMYDEAEPDVVITTKDVLIVVECKLESPIFREQLEREISVGKQRISHSRKKRVLVLLCVSKEPKEPEWLPELRIEYPDIAFRWIRWQDIREFFHHKVHEKGIDPITRRTAKDLVSVLDRKGLVRFMGFDKDYLKTLKDAFPVMKAVFAELKRMQCDLLGLLEEYEIESVYPKNWHDDYNRITSYECPVVSESATLDFRHKDWPSEKWFDHKYLFVRLMISRDTGGLWAGYNYSIWSDKDNEIITERAKQIIEFAKNNDYQIARQSTEGPKKKSCLEIEEISPDSIVEEEFFGTVNFIEISKRFDCLDLKLEQIVETLVQLTSFINSIKLVPVPYSGN